MDLKIIYYISKNLTSYFYRMKTSDATNFLNLDSANIGTESKLKRIIRWFQTTIIYLKPNRPQTHNIHTNKHHYQNPYHTIPKRIPT
jgi:hypothetical protein